MREGRRRALGPRVGGGGTSSASLSQQTASSANVGMRPGSVHSRARHRPPAPLTGTPHPPPCPAPARAGACGARRSRQAAVAARCARRHAARRVARRRDAVRVLPPGPVVRRARAVHPAPQLRARPARVPARLPAARAAGAPPRAAATPAADPGQGRRRRRAVRARARAPHRRAAAVVAVRATCASQPSHALGRAAQPRGERPLRAQPCPRAWVTRVARAFASPDQHPTVAPRSHRVTRAPGGRSSSLFLSLCICAAFGGACAGHRVLGATGPSVIALSTWCAAPGGGCGRPRLPWRGGQRVPARTPPAFSSRAPRQLARPSGERPTQTTNLPGAHTGWAASRCWSRRRAGGWRLHCTCCPGAPPTTTPSPACPHTSASPPAPAAPPPPDGLAPPLAARRAPGPLRKPAQRRRGMRFARAPAAA